MHAAPLARRLVALFIGLLAGACVLIASGLPAASAAPAPYPPRPCATLSVSTTTPYGGQSITVSGTGFSSGDQVTLEMRGDTNATLGHVTVGSDGRFSTEVKIPDDAHGHFLIYADGGHPSCPVDPVVLDVRSSLGIGGVAVGPNGASAAVAGASSAGGLAFTGLDVLLLVVAGLILIGTGVLLTRGGRRRARSGW